MGAMGWLCLFLSLAEGVRKAMFLRRLIIAALVLFGLGLGGIISCHTWADQPAALQQIRQPGSGTKAESGDERATRLARAAHAQAATIEKLPRLSYRGRYRHGVVDSMRFLDDVPLDKFKTR